MVSQWFYPDDLKDDLQGIALPPERRAEALACAWEYNRCVVPQFTNWERYIALARLCEIAIVAEVFGDHVDVLSDGPLLGHDVDALLDILFGQGPIREEMAREYRCCLLMMTEKSTGRRDTPLIRRYIEALASSPQAWFRLRDCDGLSRFYIAAAIACNDEDAWLSEEENQLLAEIGVVLYDAVAFHKHRAEGEIHNTYAYAGAEERTYAYSTYREVLWALDTHWSRSAAGRSAVNFVRLVGGPIHQMMRRYRFVEDDLMVGRPETGDVVSETRNNVKLWYRLDADPAPADDKARFEAVMAQADRVLLPGMAELLERPERDRCPDCRYRDSYGAEAAGKFGGVELCSACRTRWHDHLHSFPERASHAYRAPTRS
ncbi:hypothetical protein ACFRI7_03035 [Streptomyces sp. NPDC056716]|uniref:hypothetical protein n=1 Tax=unclassified Streptomyces TaxID=2593676 RepID=UPI00368EBF5A